MRLKKHKRLRGLAASDGKKTALDLPLEFEGRRAYVVWDLVRLGHHELKARIEIDPQLLEEAGGEGLDYLYRGPLVLPRPENN
jgi:hypothetical protein